MKFLEKEVLASLCRSSFYHFLKEFWGEIIHEPFYPNWHIEYLCNEAQAVVERVMRNEPKEYDVVGNIPPGTTKSTIFSQMLPAWGWTRKSSLKYICGSYAQALAWKDSLRTRDIVLSEKYQYHFPNVKLRDDQSTKGIFENVEKGFRMSVGIGTGTATGFHAHILIIDDPINPEEAFSEPELKAKNRWMETTLPTRVVDKDIAPMFLVGQRLAKSDPSGDFLERMKGNRVKHICLPAELTDNVKPVELREKYVDGLLDPKRLSHEVLKNARKALGEYGYASQFLQDPVPAGGLIFQVSQIQRLQVAPECERYIRSWDKAGSLGTGAFTAGVLMGRTRDKTYGVLDVIRGQWGSTERERRIRETTEKDAAMYGHVTTIVEMEGGSGGKESAENTIKNLAGFDVRKYRPSGKKTARAYGYSSQVGGGNVWVLDRDWTRDYLEELRYFWENARYKDQVDASSSAFQFLTQKQIHIGGAW